MPSPFRPEDTVRPVLMVWLLGLGQAVLAYVIVSVDARHGASRSLQATVLVISACLAGDALWSGSRLLYRGALNPSLRAATFMAALVLLRLVLRVFGV